MDTDILFNSSNGASVQRQRIYQFLGRINWRSCVFGIIFGSSLSILLTLSLFLIIAPYLNDKPEAESPFAASLNDIDGIEIRFSDWQWGSCSKTCGIGVQEGVRTSICQQKVHCLDNETEILRRHCISEHCSAASLNDIDGIEIRFSDWQWGSCSKTCGIGVQEGVRTSICQQKVHCLDNETEILRRHCISEHCSVDGKWSVWMQEPCSVTCGVGSRLRHRQCSNPHPQYGGKNCTGKSIEQLNCLQPTCCPEDTLNCDGGWMRRDDFGACYCFSGQTLSWNSAQAQCKKQAGSLADIYSENEAVWLSNSSRLHTGTSVWIGGKRDRYRYKWFTSDGKTKTMNYTRWAPGEPKIYDPKYSHYICVNLWPRHQYKWDDFVCSHKLNFICKTYL
ncbi:HMCN [Mytilus coruscus]|uniref:HMCN n=1 Tax=Mytilus coruscus TaxID=42192 RepID=A0A6J8CZB3_MYTCO|nr:HMCN [Mytilus coruscus]